MPRYPYDELLAPHFQKLGGIVGQAAWGLAKMAPGAAITVGTGIPVGKAGMPIAIGQAAMSAVNATGGQAAQERQKAERQVVAAWSEGGSRREKRASSHGLATTLGHMSPYAAWIGAKALEEKHPMLSKALSAGAYLGYAGLSAHDAITNPAERVTGAIDGVALLAMLGSDVARWRRP